METRLIIGPTEKPPVVRKDLENTESTELEPAGDENFDFGFDLLAEKRDSERIKGLDSGYDSFDISKERRGVLSYQLLRQIYVRSSYVRPCIDALVRSVSSLPWVVRPKTGGNPKHAKWTKEFFQDPNSNEESLRSILAQILTDVMVIDAGALEKVKSYNGDLLEIFARDGATFIPDRDEHGILHGYTQKLSGTEDKVPFSKDEIIYFQLFPTTWNPYGLPIIETIVNEVASLMFSVQWISDSFTLDKIPPGILVMDRIGKEAYNRAKAEFQSGEEGKFAVKLFRNTGDTKWIELKRGNAEMQLAELNLQIERIVYRNFGIQPFELGVTTDINRATAMMALRVSQNRVYKPLIQTINYYFNQNLIRPVFEDVYFKLIPMSLEDPESRSRAIGNYVKQEILTKDEARRLIEEDFFVEGGLE